MTIEPVASTRRRISIIDDSRSKSSALEYILKNHFDVNVFPSGKAALPAMEVLPPDLILLDIEMPEENGFIVICRLKAHPVLQDIPVIFITSMDDRRTEAEGLSLGAVDFISGGMLVPETILARINIHLELRGYRRNLESIILGKTRQVEQLQDSIVICLSDLVECRDEITSGHAQRTIRYMETLCTALRDRGVYTDILTPLAIKNFMRAAPLHDIGKVGIDDAILNKPGKLTPEEFTIMKRHTTLGGKAIRRAIDNLQDPSFLENVWEMTQSHHERWDGKGYPNGLSGDDIPLSARLMAFADVYDALVSVRPYKAAMTHKEAVSIIRQERGHHFDPRITDVFLEIHDQFAVIAQTPMSGEEDSDQV